MRRGGKGDAIPLIAFHNAPLFKAGFFTPVVLKIEKRFFSLHPAWTELDTWKSMRRRGVGS
jgi:hypothetical protein